MIRDGSHCSAASHAIQDNERRPRLRALLESTEDGSVEEIEAPSATSPDIGAEQSSILLGSAMPKPCLVFAAQVYLDIDQITLSVDFPYQHAVTLLGKKIYTYMNWLSCQTLKRHIKTMTLTPSMDLLPIMDEMPEVRDRGPYASMSLAPRGIWQEGMGDFGRIVGMKISRDVGAAVTRGTVARMNPNRDAILSPWSWGSRAMHVLAESLRFGAKGMPFDSLRKLLFIDECLAYNEGGMFIVVAHMSVISPHLPSHLKREQIQCDAGDLLFHAQVAPHGIIFGNSWRRHL